jgi:hypothetical protein
MTTLNDLEVKSLISEAQKLYKNSEALVIRAQALCDHRLAARDCIHMHSGKICLCTKCGKRWAH